MDIRTAKNPMEPESIEASEPMEKNRYLRRKGGSKFPWTSRFFIRAVRVVPILAKTFFLVAVVAFLFSVFNYAYTSETFRLRTLSFEGCKQTNSPALEQMVRRSFPANTLTIDLRELQRTLESEAWIRRAEIRRVLPAEIIVYIEERIPSVILELNSELVLSDDEGILLDRFDSKYGKLDVPVFKGLIGATFEEYRENQKENSARVRLGKKMLTDLESGSPLFTRNISEVDLSDRTNVRLMLIDDTAEVFLGDHDFLKRFRMLVENTRQYEELKSQYTEIASVDLRFDGQIIYRPRKLSEKNPGAGVSPAPAQNP